MLDGVPDMATGVIGGFAACAAAASERGQKFLESQEPAMLSCWDGRGQRDRGKGAILRMAILDNAITE